MQIKFLYIVMKHNILCLSSDLVKKNEVLLQIAGFLNSNNAIQCSLR